MIRHHLYVHRKKYYIGGGILIFLIAAAYTYLKLSAALHFTLQTELLITHDPTQVFLSVENNSSTAVTIKTSIDTFHSCSFVCGYQVDGLYSLQNQTAKKLEHTFRVPAPASGFGEQMYLFKTSCVTVPSAFCPSSGRPTNQTTLIVVNYSLSHSEARVVADKAAIEQTVAAADDLISRVNYTRQLLAMWPIAVDVPSTTEIERKRNALVHDWDMGNYNAVGQDQLSLRNSLFTLDIPDQIIAQIHAFNDLRSRINSFFGNATVGEYVSYAQVHDPQPWTTKQAVDRLSGIESQAFTANLNRTSNIAIGAMQYLSDQTQAYLTMRDPALAQIALATRVRPFIRTPLTGLPTDTCDAVAALRAHNAWAARSNNSVLSQEQVSALTTPVNATYIFPLPADFCIIQQNPINITWPSTSNETFAPIGIPARSLVPVINLSLPSAACSVQMPTGVFVACPRSRSPIIFIHGHAFDQSNSPQISMQAFTQIQERLEQDGLVDAGELGAVSAQDVIAAPFTVRSSFYYIKSYGIGDYSFDVEKSERIENYALRLKSIIDDVKMISGSPNVTIVAHSMGGLVVREYATLFGSDSLDHIITINAPHQGIVGRSVAACNLLGAAKECDDMTANSTFLRGLAPVSGRWDLIASTGCQMKEGEGDGVVLLQNANLSGASSLTILHGSCTDLLGTNLHTQILTQDQLYMAVHKLLFPTRASTVNITHR